MKDPYEDILFLPHHVSSRRPRMSLADRAAQFAPFAALTGYEEAIAETRRHTECRPELGEYDVTLLDRKYRRLAECASERPKITISRFVPDLKKDGGAYEVISGRLKKIDPYTQSILLTDGSVIPFPQIIALEWDPAPEGYD